MEAEETEGRKESWVRRFEKSGEDWDDIEGEIESKRKRRLERFGAYELVFWSVCICVPKDSLRLLCMDVNAKAPGMVMLMPNFHNSYDSINLHIGLLSGVLFLSRPTL